MRMNILEPQTNPSSLVRLLDLTGKWKVCLREGEVFGAVPETFPLEMTLPGTLSQAGIAPLRLERHRRHLTDPHAFEGTAWFRRTFEAAAEWEEQDIFLEMERTRRTRVWVDGLEAGAGDSLCAPQVIPLPRLTPGTHTLTAAVCNLGYPTSGGHMTSPDTQTNWLGITGRIALRIRPKVRADRPRVLWDARREEIGLSCFCTGAGEVGITLSDGWSEKRQAIPGENRWVLRKRGTLACWEISAPALHRMTLTMSGESQTFSFGLREISADGRKLRLNGREVFLRGTHEGLVFPMTGAAPTDRASWLTHLRRIQAYGLNHVRCHTCVPPEAALEAADALGILFELELPFWGNVPEEETAEFDYLLREGLRILEAFGNHPSFFLLSLGNELWGSAARMSAMLRTLREADGQRLYTDGSNNFQFTPRIVPGADVLCGVRLSRERLYRGSYAMCDAPLGFLQTEQPHTAHRYDPLILSPEGADGKAAAGAARLVQTGESVREVTEVSGGISVPELPVISHEVGQFAMYPDYAEIDHYTGVLKAENLALFREKAEERGLLPWAEAFHRASGALAAACYRLEVEAAMKSRELAGFQLLDIKDYPGQGTALVGMMNSLMEPRSCATPEDWRAFCGPRVPLAALKTFVLGEEESVSFEMLAVDTLSEREKTVMRAQLLAGRELLAEAVREAMHEGRVTSLGTVAFPALAGRFARPTGLTLTLSMDGCEQENAYALTVYPQLEIAVRRDAIVRGEMRVKIVETLTEAEQALRRGERPLVVPSAAGKLPGSYCTDFWNWAMFSQISRQMGKPEPVGTLGCLIQREHPALTEFPCEEFTTPVWYELITHSHCEDLSGTEIVPIVFVIDNPVRANRYGLLYEAETPAGRALVCTVRLWEIADRPEVKWFAWSLMKYLEKERGA